jgi:hypothetical protein
MADALGWVKHAPHVVADMHVDNALLVTEYAPSMNFCSEPIISHLADV